MTGLGLLTSLRGGRIEVAPVGAHLEPEVEKHEAHYEDLPRGPCLIADQRVLAVPLTSDLLLLVHVLSELEIEESDFVVGEVARQLDVHSPAAVSD